MSLQKKLNKYTKLSPDKRTKALKWMAKQNEDLILVCFEKQKENYFKLSKIDEENRSILYLSSLYLAAEELYTLLQGKKKKNRLQNLHEVKDVTGLQAKQFKQRYSSEKWDKLLNIKSKILRLIDHENLSFREVSKFLKKYHRLEVSHSYIATFYQKMKEIK